MSFQDLEFNPFGPGATPESKNLQEERSGFLFGLGDVLDRELVEHPATKLQRRGSPTRRSAAPTSTWQKALHNVASPVRRRGGQDYKLSQLRSLQQQVEARLQQVKRLEERNRQLSLRHRVLRDLVDVQRQMNEIWSRVRNEELPWPRSTPRSWTLQSFCEFWKAKVSRLGELLLREGTELEGPEVLEEITAIVREATEVKCHVWAHHLDIANRLQEINMETLRQERAPQELVKKVQEVMVVSEDQEERALEGYKILLAGYQKLGAERTRLQSALDRVAESQARGVASPLEDLSDIEDALRLTRNLQHMLHKEFQYRSLLRGYVIMKILTPLQLAKLAVTIYPYSEDPTVLMGLKPFVEKMQVYDSRS